MTTATKLPVQSLQGGTSVLGLAQAMMGDGVTVLSASYAGDARSAGIFTQGETISPGVVPSDSGIILSTGLASDFTNSSGAANQSASRSTDTAGVDGDPAMNAIAGVKTYDGAILTTQFTSTGPELTMQLVFSSEEYLEWVKSGYNDAVGIWVNGKQAQLALGAGDISIDNINTTTNPNLFLNNANSTYNTEMDGATVVLTLKAAVDVGAVNTLRIGIADAGDSIYDSNLLIVAKSVQSALIAKDDSLALTSKGIGHIDLLANDLTNGRSGVHIDMLNGVHVSAGDHVTLTTGEVLTLEADGTVDLQATANSGATTFSYHIVDASGTSDTAFVTLSTSPVDGTAGNDVMGVGYTDAQGNQIDGTDGPSEVIMGYGGDDKITAGAGNDDIYGGAGNDFIRAQDGADHLYGGDGNDVLDGGTGADTMEGGAGDDVYWVDNAGDKLVELANGGHDKVMSTIDFTLGSTFEELWLQEGSGAHLAVGNALDNKMVGNALDNTIQGLAGNDELWGAAGNDQIFGGTGNDLIFGGDGDDRILGEDGNDKLYGGAGHDTLYGGAGNDQLTAGKDGSVLQGDAGSDLLTGGAGADHFVFATGSGHDTIKGFELGHDHIDLVGISADHVHMTWSSHGLTISWGTSDQVLLADLAHVAVLHPADLGIGLPV